jgi:chemotaxis signal transduction protein
VCASLTGTQLELTVADPQSQPRPRPQAPRRRVRLLLFRVAGRGYATPWRRVRAVVDIGGGHPPVPGMPPSSLRALHPGARPAALVSLRQVIGLPDHDAPGRILVVSVRSRAVGVIVDEVVAIAEVGADQIERRPTKLSGGYVTGQVRHDHEDWSVVEWEALLREWRFQGPSLS